jgi:type IV secretion system protein VirD4
MSNQQNQTPQGKMFSALIVGGMAYAAWDYFGSVVQESGEINDEAALAAGIFAICALSFAIGAFALLADWMELVVAKSPKGNKGSAGWASWRSLRRDVLRDGFGPYWGVYAGKGRGRGQPIFADYASNALTVGTAGSGKGVGVVLPTCMAIRESKFIPDFKGTNS